MYRVIDLIAGARPNFMKIASIINAIQFMQNNGTTLHYRLIYTGQHYDESMSGSFFEQLNLPKPDINLEVGAGTQAEQTANIMIRYEKLLLNNMSDLCVVVGDVTSTMACAITAQKLNLPVAHVEGGIRSDDWKMPEEINRRVTDSITTWFFTTSNTANQNLRNEGVSDDRIFLVGNTMIDTLLKNESRLIKPKIWNQIGLLNQNYIVLTLHRPANVDNIENLICLLDKILECSNGIPIVFPVHPRTWKTMKMINKSYDSLHLLEPMSYLEFIFLVKNAKIVITDSGGITEETTVLKVPCMTLRDNTERPETITIGTNELVGTNPANIQQYFKILFSGNWKKGGIPEFWDGKTGMRIVQQLEILLGNYST